MVRHARRTAELVVARTRRTARMSQRWLTELEAGKPKILNERLTEVIAKLGISIIWTTDA